MTPEEIKPEDVGYRYGYGTDISGDELDFFDILKDRAVNSRDILEVGVGNGRMINILKRYTDAKFSGCDIIPNPYDVADARNLPYKNDSFDLVYSLGAVEHFRETGQAIREQYRVVRPFGSVICIVPSLSINGTWRFFKQLFNESNPEKIHARIGRQIRVDELKLYFADAGFKIRLCFRFGGICPFDKTHPIITHFTNKVRGRMGSFIFIEGVK